MTKNLRQIYSQYKTLKQLVATRNKQPKGYYDDLMEMVGLDEAKTLSLIPLIILKKKKFADKV